MAAHGSRLVEAFLVVGLRGDTISLQLEQQEKAWGAQPLSDRVFMPAVLASFPPNEALPKKIAMLLKDAGAFCFPDGLSFARLDTDMLRVPRFGSFVLTTDELSRLYGYALEFWEPADAALAEKAGAGSEGGGAWSVPVAICFLCTAPCAQPMERLLRALHAAHDAQSLGHAPPVALSIVHAVHNLPALAAGAPPVVLHVAGTSIRFDAPSRGGLLPPLEYSLRCLTDTLGTRALMELFTALITEQKVIFVSSQHQRLCRAAVSACALLYPLEWRQVWVPLLPSTMLAVLHTPFPAVLGLRLEQLLLAGSRVPDNVVWVHLDRGRVDGGSTAPLPRTERVWLAQALDEALAAAEGKDVRVRVAFLGFLTSLLRDYHHVLPETSLVRRRTARDERAVDDVLLRRPRRDRAFFRALYDSQLYRQFGDAQASARASGRLPAGLAPFERARSRAWYTLQASLALPPGTWWFFPEAGEHQREAVDVEPPAPLVVPPEAWTAGAEEASPPGSTTAFPTDLRASMARVVALPREDPDVYVDVDGAREPLLGTGAGPGLLDAAVRRGEVLAEDLAVDRERYVVDEAYRADAEAQQRRTLATAGVVALGGATVGAVACEVQ